MGGIMNIKKMKEMNLTLTDWIEHVVELITVPSYRRIWSGQAWPHGKHRPWSWYMRQQKQEANDSRKKAEEVQKQVDEIFKKFEGSLYDQSNTRN
jgi:hypothetical protein